MPSIPVQCMVCGKSVKDSMFPQHMQGVHGGMSQSEAMMAEKNIPNPQIPIVLDKDAPPSDDFMEVAAMLDKPKETPSEELKKKLVNPFIPKVEEKDPITLKYKYEGTCPKCNTPIKTVVIKPGSKWFAVAFCLDHEEITQQEVTPLIKEELVMEKIPTVWIQEGTNKILSDPNKVFTKRGGKRGKRSKSIVQSKVAL